MIWGNNETYSIQSGQLLGHFSHWKEHKVVFVFILRERLNSVLQITLLLSR